MSVGVINTPVMQPSLPLFFSPLWLWLLSEVILLTKAGDFFYHSSLNECTFMYIIFLTLALSEMLALLHIINFAVGRIISTNTDFFLFDFNS